MLRDLVVGNVDVTMRGIRVDGPDDWFALCPPPCDSHHKLAQALPNHTDDSPVLVLQPRVERTNNPTTGIVVCGRSRITPSNESAPLIDRLSPRLAAMTFKVILTTDIGATLTEICANIPAEATNVELPVVVANNCLYTDADRLQQTDIDLAVLCLLDCPDLRD